METGPEALRRYRKLRNGMSQEALARLADVSLATVQAAEQGKYAPKPATARAYDDALEAEGAILAAFGYVANGSADYVTQSEFDQLRDEVQRLAKVVDRIEHRLRETGGFEGTPPAGLGRPSA